MAKSEEEYRALFEGDPTHLDAFASLRRMYRQDGRHEDLAWLFETRAEHIDKGSKAAELYMRAADVRISKLGDEEAGIDDLLKAMRLDPTQRRVIQQLKKKLKEASRWEEYLEVLEQQLKLLTGTPGRERKVSALHLEMGTLLEEHFAQRDKAMYHYQQAVRADGRNVEALAAAKRLYREMGEWPMVARLLKAEIRVTAGGKKRVELLNELGQVMANRLHDLKGAAKSLQEVLAASPGHIRAMETLGEVYSSPDWDAPGGSRQAAQIFYQLARQYVSQDKKDEALNYLKRTLAADPGHREASRALAEVYESLGEYEELESHLLHQIQKAEGGQAVDLLMRRGQLLEEHLGDREEAKRCYEQILPYEPPGGAASSFLCELYVEDGEFQKLAELRERELEAIDDERRRIDKMMELAVLYRDRLQNEDKAAILLHDILELEPNNPVALEYYQQHFRAKGDYRGLADLLAFAAEGSLRTREGVPEALDKLAELAEISERKLGDLDRAMDAWHQIAEIQPNHPEAAEQVRRLQRKQRMWESVLSALERDVQAAQTERERVQALLRMAQTYWDKRMDPLRNIEILNEVLAYDPGNPTALKALAALYRRESDSEGLANTIKMQLEGRATDRVERVKLLRKLAEISYEELHNLRDAGWACTQILDVVPGDPEAIALLSKVLEEMEDWPKLVKTLRYYAKAAGSTEEKIKILRNMTKVATEKLDDDVLAAEAWEKIMRLDPDDTEALSALTSLYEKLGRWAQLADVLERRGKSLATEDEEAFRKYMRRLARVADTRLGDPDRALEAWRAVSEVIPDDKEALGALTRLYYEEEDWEGVCEVLRRQIPLADEPNKIIGLSLRLADILDEHLGQSREAVEVLERLLEETDPTNRKVMEGLRKLYVTVGEPAKAVQIAEKELELVEDPQSRQELSLEIAAAWRDEVGDDEQAIEAYERVLDEQPASRDALSALVVLYTRTGRWEKLIETNKLLFDFADNDRERLRLLFQIAEVYEERLEEPGKAFEWYRRAFELFPGDRGTLTSLERSAAENDLWEPLIEVYEEMRARSQHPAQHLEIAAKISRIRERELGEPDQAFDVLRGALVVDLTGEEFLPELERLAEQHGRWDDLVEIYERVLRHRRTVEERIALLHKSAAVLEDELEDLKAALGRIRRAFELDSTDLTTSDWMMRLAEQTESWDDLLAVLSARYSAAPSLKDRLDLVRQSARIVEQKVGDKLKAFRAYLHGFLIDPEDDDILAELWRLAEEIGVYSDETIESDEAHRRKVEREAKEAARRKKRRAQKRKKAFGPSSLAGSSVMMDGGHASPSPEPVERPDVTQELDLMDLEIVDEEEVDEEPVVRDPTVQISISDVLEIEAVRTGEVPLLEASSEFDLLDKAEGGKEPREPFSDDEDTGKHMLAGLVGKDLPPAKSAWEDFARAYAMLPAPDQETKRRYCHRIAEIWRDGAGELRKAFEALRWALELDVTAEDTRIQIEEVARRAEMVEDLAELQIRILEDVHGMDIVVFLNREVARLFEEIGKMDRAEHHYQNILSIKPDYQPAFERLQEIYRETERWEDLAALDERQMEDLLDGLPAGPEREAKLRELATLYEEKLDRPYEAMEAWSRLLSMKEEDIEAYRALARLAAKTGSWARAVEALGHIEELTAVEEEVLSCRRRMARIYKDELELPDRAIDLYQQILNLQPEDAEALQCLDELYETHEAWDSLEGVLELRARLTEEQEQWEELTRRRAEVLADQLGDYSAAADSYEALRAALPDKGEYAEQAVRLLREAGRIEDALSVFDERLDLARQGKVPSGQVAALLVRKANLVSQALGDLDAARQLLEEALELVPDYPSALGELARLHRDEEDWPAYVEARVREAEAAADSEDKAAALIEAGNVYRQRLGQIDKARECLRKALEANEESADALSALAEMAREQHDWEEALALMKRQVEACEDPQDKAALFTEMASIQMEGMSNSEEAESLLENALALDRDHVPAVIALADLYYNAERWEEAKSLMEDALQRLEGHPRLAAKLGYRLAGLYQARGEENEAYKFLREIDRRNPNQFALKLALGENRFRVRRWREAAKILSALADHPEADQHPGDTARALCMAAEAEKNQRRPGKAPALWTKALEFKPDNLEAINALVKYHTDRGALNDAATYLQAKAEATEDSETKVSLWDSLGDLYHDKLEDDDGALSCYTEALEAAEPIERKHLPILEKVFPLCRAVGDDEQAARIIGFILAFTEDPELRAPREVQAADAYVALGDTGRAIEHLESALELDPMSEPAVTMLVDIYEQKEDYRSAADLLSSYLGRLDEMASDPAEWSRRAALHERLADLYQHGLEDPPAAIEILDQALELDPTRLSCRERLAELYGDAPQFEEKAFYNHQALVADDVRRSNSLASLARIYQHWGEIDKALCVNRVLEIQGEADLDALGFIAEHSAGVLPVDGRWPGVLEEEDRAELLAHPKTKTMGEVFATVWEGAPALFGGGLERFGLSAKDRISPVADMDLAKIYGSAARALGNRLTGLYLSWTGDYEGVNIGCHAPPLIVVGPDAEDMELGELRFRLGRALELTRPEYILAAGLEPSEFNSLFVSVLRAFHPRHSRRKLDDSDAIGRRAKQLKKDLPYRVSKKLVGLLQEKAHVEFNSVVWRSAVKMSGNRAGLLVCGDLKAAVRVVLMEEAGVDPQQEEMEPEDISRHMDESEALRDLLSFAVSEDYFQARKRLGQDVVIEEAG